MLLTEAAFNILTSDCNPPMVKINESDFPKGIVFSKSECGTQLYYLGDYIAILILLPIEGVRSEGSLHYMFYRRCDSNFSAIHGAPITINGKPVSKIHCGEQLFKAGCVLLHMQEDPAEDVDAVADDYEARTANRLAVLSHVMGAASPADCKGATGALKPFYADLWDKASFDVMTEVQYWKATDSENHAFKQFLGSLCKDHGIPFTNVGIYEATVPDDKGRVDRIWGTGVGVADMLAVIREQPDLYWFSPDGGEVSTGARPFAGKNLLGRALQLAFKRVVGDAGEHLGESVEAYIARVGTESPLFVYLPVWERTVSAGSSPLPERSGSKCARTLSCADVGECRTATSEA